MREKNDFKYSCQVLVHSSLS